MKINYRDLVRCLYITYLTTGRRTSGVVGVTNFILESFCRSISIIITKIPEEAVSKKQRFPMSEFKERKPIYLLNNLNDTVNCFSAMTH